MNRKMKIGGLAAASLMLSACATSPNKISAAYVSPMKYDSFDCGQIAVEQAGVEQRTNALYHSLKKRNTNDKWMMGVGMLVAWPALFFLKGNNGVQNAEYAQLKGEYDALRHTSVAKKCDIAFKDDLAKAVAARPEAGAGGGSAAPAAAARE